MEIRCKATPLRNAFSLLSTVCPSRTPKPALANLRFTGRDGKVSLEATDLEIWARMSWKEEIKEPFDTLLPLSPTGGLLKEVDDDVIDFDIGEKATTLRTREAVWKVHAMPTAEFPAWPEFKPEVEFTAPADQITTGIKRVAFAAAQERTRYALNGILFSADGKAQELVATDGRRLALCRIEAKKSKGEGKCILGTRAAQLAEKALGEADGPVAVAFDKRFLSLTGDGIELLSRLVEGNYPDHRAVVPKELPESARLHRAALERGIRKAALVTSATSGSVLLKLGSGKLEISAQSAEEGEAKVTLEARYSGKGQQIRFNPRFLLDALRAPADEEVSLDLKDSTSAGLLRLAKDYLYVVLPVHLVT